MVIVAFWDNIDSFGVRVTLDSLHTQFYVKHLQSVVLTSQMIFFQDPLQTHSVELTRRGIYSK